MASAGNTQSIKRIIDYTNSTGTPGDILSTTVNGLEWVTGGGGGVGTLQQVCTNGNTTNTSIIMTGKIDIETDGAINPISIGKEAGLTNQGVQAIAIGYQSGATNQGVHAVAIGTNAGGTNQAAESVAIGNQCGYTGQSQKSVAIGFSSGMLTQGAFAVAIGCQAGATAQSNNAIAIGEEAGEGYQGDEAVAIGRLSGATTQGIFAVAVGSAAGSHKQGQYAVAIGNAAGATNQGQYAIAIGNQAGYTSQGANAIAIGNQAGYTSQAANSIILNASGSQLNNSTVSGFFVNPVRTNGTDINLIGYSSSSEIVKSANVYIQNNDLYIASNVHLGSNVYDSTNSIGTPGQILSSTSTGTSWITSSTTNQDIPFPSGTSYTYLSCFNNNFKFYDITIFTQNNSGSPCIISFNFGTTSVADTGTWNETKTVLYGGTSTTTLTTTQTVTELTSIAGTGQSVVNFQFYIFSTDYYIRGTNDYNHVANYIVNSVKQSGPLNTTTSMYLSFSQIINGRIYITSSN
jgi:hypothetical protein